MGDRLGLRHCFAISVRSVVPCHPTLRGLTHFPFSLTACTASISDGRRCVVLPIARPRPKLLCERRCAIAISPTRCSGSAPHRIVSSDPAMQKDPRHPNCWMIDPDLGDAYRELKRPFARAFERGSYLSLPLSSHPSFSSLLSYPPSPSPPLRLRPPPPSTPPPAAASVSPALPRRSPSGADRSEYALFHFLSGETEKL